jgi:hypothetical protein
MPNKRVFYAGRQIGFAKDGTAVYIEAHGVQSIGITTNFNLEQVFEQGQLSIYQNIEQIPDIEVTMEKVLDGYPLLYHLATNGALTPSLSGRSNVKTIVAMSVFTDTGDSATGIPIAEVSMSGLVPTALTYTIPIDGNCSESITLIGNNKVWRDDETLGTGIFTGRFNNQDSPLYSGGVQRRQHVIMVPPTGTFALDVNGTTTAQVSTWPKEIPGINASGINPVAADGTFVTPLQSVTVTCDLGRQTIFELGRKSPYWRFVAFPVEVRTEIEVISTKWDNVSGTEAGLIGGNNTVNQTIKIALTDGTYITMGTKNRLATVAMTGGDAGGGGGNVSHRYSYVTYNDLIVSHPADPSGL